MVRDARCRPTCKHASKRVGFCRSRCCFAQAMVQKSLKIVQDNRWGHVMCRRSGPPRGGPIRSVLRLTFSIAEAMQPRACTSHHLPTVLPSDRANCQGPTQTARKQRCPMENSFTKMRCLQRTGKLVYQSILSTAGKNKSPGH